MTIKSFAFIKTADAFEYDFILDASLSLDTFIPFFITDIFIGNKNISFITKNKVIFIKTERLREYAEKMIEGKELVYDTPKDFYIPYQRKRWGRKDITFKCPINDLIELNDFIIKFDVLK
jgi:hypothetical protein